MYNAMKMSKYVFFPYIGYMFYFLVLPHIQISPDLYVLQNVFKTIPCYLHVSIDIACCL